MVVRAAVVALCWAVRYVTVFGTGVPSWRGWADQGLYLRSASAFAHGDLSAAAHFYPLAYPLLAAPFAWAMPGDPFLLPDLALFVVTAFGFAHAARRLGLGANVALAIFVATTLIQKGIARAWLAPWTTTLSAALLWWALALATDVAARDTDAPAPRRLAILGAMLAALPATRPADGLVAVAIGLWVLAPGALRRPRDGRGPIAFFAGGAAVVLVFGLLHLAIYGPHPTSYMVGSRRIGFVFADLGWKAHVLLVSAEPWYPGGRSIAEMMPWTPLGLAGLIAAMLAPGPAARHLRPILAVATLYTIPMLAYADLVPNGLWRFGNIHYFKWMMPLLGAGIVLLVPLLRRWQGAAGLLVVVTALAIQLRPVPIGADVPARMLTFATDPARGWNARYFAPATISDSAGSLLNIIDFHQIPSGDRVQAIAIRRPFAVGPLRDDAGEPPALASGEPPIGRYGERIAVGLPCAFVRHRCRFEPAP